MRKITAAFVYFAFAISIAAYADPTPSTTPDDSQLVDHGHYTNKDGQDVHSPARTKSGTPPSGATAKCGDGTYSFSQHHSGTCSHHRGVSQWLD
jgi:hypothetical protein